MRITVERPLKVKWRITDTALTALEKSKAWKTWAKAGHAFTPADIYGPDGKLGQQWQITHDTADSLRNALSDNMGGGVPIDVIKALVDAAQVADPDGVLIADKKGNPQPDSDLRDNENVPLPATAVQWEADVADRLATIEYRTTVNDYLTDEVHPYVPDAWVDYDKTKIGYEIPLTRHFYKYVQPRSLADIDAEIKQLESEIQDLLREVAE